LTNPHIREEAVVALKDAGCQVDIMNSNSVRGL